MKKLLRIILFSSLALVGVLAIGGIAYADPPIIEDGFVCPVLGGNAGTNGNLGDTDHLEIRVLR
jgi:hypothetical protein